MSVYRADAQLGTFVSLPERPTETYPQMSWDAELALNEYLIVGGRYGWTETLGHQFFVRPDEVPPAQRVLVIQMGAAPPETPPGAPAPGQAGTPSRSAPLAYQTAWPAAQRPPPDFCVNFNRLEETSRKDRKDRHGPACLSPFAFFALFARGSLLLVFA